MIEQLSVFAPAQGLPPMPLPAQAKKEPLFVVTAVYELLLRGVYLYQMATADQLTNRFYSMGSLTTIKTRLRELERAGYLLHVEYPTFRGNAPYVYTLSRKGLRYCETLGFDVKTYFCKSQEQRKGNLFIDHTLDVNRVLIAAANLEKFAPDYSLHSFIHERTLKQSPFKVKVLRSVGGMMREETVTLIPDAYLDFRHMKETGKEEKIPVLLELDRGTIERKHFQKKIRAYIEFIKDEGYKDAFGVSTVTVAYAIAEGGTKRLKELMDWTRKEMESTNEKGWLSDLFLFTVLPEDIDPKELFLAPSWYTPFNENNPLSLLAE